MIYLILAIVCSSSIGIIFKISERSHSNRYVVTSTNYLTAVLVSFMLLLSKNISLRVSANLFISEAKNVFYRGQIFSPGASGFYCIILGIPTGMLFLLSFLYYQKSVALKGVALAGTFSKIGILFPTLLSILIWREVPNAFQGIGILLALLSIVFIKGNSEKASFKDGFATLMLLFIFDGLAEFSNKLFQRYSLDNYNVFFLLVLFSFAFILSLRYSLRDIKNTDRKDFFLGICVGIPNQLCSLFLIKALNYIKTPIAFATYSAGSILLMSLSAIFLFKEKLKKRELLCIILIAFSLILMNL